VPGLDDRGCGPSSLRHHPRDPARRTNDRARTVSVHHQGRRARAPLLAAPLRRRSTWRFGRRNPRRDAEVLPGARLRPAGFSACGGCDPGHMPARFNPCWMERSRSGGSPVTGTARPGSGLVRTGSLPRPSKSLTDHLSSAKKTDGDLPKAACAPSRAVKGSAPIFGNAPGPRTV